MIFRYPGSKAKFLSIFKREFYPDIGESFADVFVGGGSVLLDVAEKYPKVKLQANDLNKNIYAFWKLVADEHLPLEPLYGLLDQTPTVELFTHLRNTAAEDLYGFAYRAVFFNRTTFSGIEISGPIGGMNQASKWDITSRYSATKLKAAITKARNLLGGRTKVTNLDAISSLNLFDGFLYLDPPYFHKGNKLYSVKMSAEGHAALAEALGKIENPWALSYDDCEEIENMYDDFQIIYLDARYSINGVKKTWAKKGEVLIRPLWR